MSVEVLCVGLTTIDLVYTGVDRPIVGVKTQAESASMYTGGPAANAAIAAAALGASTALCTAIDSGPLALMAISELAEHRVQVLTAQTDATPISTVLIEPNGERSVVSVNGAQAEPNAPAALTEAATNARVVLVDGHYPSMALPALELACHTDATTLIDLGSWKPWLPTLLPLCNVAIASADFTTPGESAVATLFEYGVEFLAISHGGRAIEWHSQDGTSGRVDVRPVNVISTNGAGDVLHGAFARLIAQGADFVSALEQASRLASASCTHYPARIPPHTLATNDVRQT